MKIDAPLTFTDKPRLHEAPAAAKYRSTLAMVSDAFGPEPAHRVEELPAHRPTLIMRFPQHGSIAGTCALDVSVVFVTRSIKSTVSRNTGANGRSGAANAPIRRR